MDRKEVKHLLKSSCRGALQELLNEVGFNELEAKAFREKYFYEHSVPMICLKIGVSSCKYNDLHNRICDKIISYFSHIK